ncbi:polysaccharide biosynthesis protein, partial [Staphylococcus aureus]|uniref:polysaccharide biosynthesis protein n=1 Tax=Staphylococcus aureus TaxID=1280 RepID=UPI0037D9E6E8
MYLINPQLPNRFPKNLHILPIIPHLQNTPPIFQIIQTYKPYPLYHPPPHNHLPLMQHNPQQPLPNNILRTKNTTQP